jgi:enoyl-CoA hydratase/carnithine racemase
VSELIVERTNGVVTVIINRPHEKNAITYALFDVLSDEFLKIASQRTDRVLVLRGSEGNFSTGLSLSDPERFSKLSSPEQLLKRVNETVLNLHNIGKPSVAIVEGWAVGAGLSLAIGCDFIVASPLARLCTVFSRRGLSMDSGMSWLLPRIVGVAKAKELALLAEFVSAKEALAMGLIYKVSEPDNLEETANALVQILSRGPTVAYGADLELLNNSLNRTFEESITKEAVLQIESHKSRDSKEAIAAFLEKRDAIFHGD